MAPKRRKTEGEDAETEALLEAMHRDGISRRRRADMKALLFKLVAILVLCAMLYLVFERVRNWEPVAPPAGAGGDDGKDDGEDDMDDGDDDVDDDE